MARSVSPLWMASSASSLHRGFEVAEWVLLRPDPRPLLVFEPVEGRRLSRGPIGPPEDLTQSSEYQSSAPFGRSACQHATPFGLRISARQHAQACGFRLSAFQLSPAQALADKAPGEASAVLTSGGEAGAC